MRMYTGLAGYEQRIGKPFRAWLFVIARNVALKRLVAPAAYVEDAHAVLALRERLQREPNTPADISAGDVMHIIERLPRLQGQVLLLRYSFDWTHAQIAVVLGKSADAVRKLDDRARKLLVERLAYPEHGSHRPQRMSMLSRQRPVPVVTSRRFALSGARSWERRAY